MYQTYKKEKAKIGSKVASYPDHNGMVWEGIIFEINDTELRVNYYGYGNVTLKHSGRLISDKVHTSLDVGMIDI